jgi:hypothetical protein
VREKRWAVYVSRAATRFEVWWRKTIPATKGGQPCSPLRAVEIEKRKDYSGIAGEGQPPANFTTSSLPPIGMCY